MSCPQQSQTPQCPAHNRVRLRSVLPSAESDSTVSCPQQSQTSQCLALSRVRLHSVLPSAESDSAVSCPQQSQTPQCPVLNRARLRGVLPSAESDFAVSSTLPLSFRKFMYFKSLSATHSLTDSGPTLSIGLFLYCTFVCADQRGA